MDDFFMINNAILKLAEIEKCEVVEKEVIKRPVFREIQRPIIGITYKEEPYEVYGIILGEEGNHAAMTGFAPLDMAGTVVKDVMRLPNAIVSNLGDKLNLKDIKYKKYRILLYSGRISNELLVDIPGVLITKEGVKKDVYNNTDLQRKIGKEIMPFRDKANVIQVEFNTKHDPQYFFEMADKTLTLENVGIELQRAVLTYQAQLEKEKSQKKLADGGGSSNAHRPKIDLPKVELPKLDLPRIDVSFRKNTGPRISIKPTDKK